jgi:tetratricopeptide (TPR) repeat protein
MSEWRDIWAESIKANKELIKNRIKGEVEFKKQLSQHPNDGMVFYSRGEAYEHLTELDLAMEDYKKAEINFPAPHWKELAKYALARVEKKKSTGKDDQIGNDIQDIIHRIYGVTCIPHKVRVDALSAIERFDSEPHMSAGLLRLCIEELVNTILKNASIDYYANEELDRKIDKLEARGVITPLIASKMQIVRDLGNKGLHPGIDYRTIVYEPILDSFIAVLELISNR